MGKKSEICKTLKSYCIELLMIDDDVFSKISSLDEHYYRFRDDFEFFLSCLEDIEERM